MLMQMAMSRKRDRFWNALRAVHGFLQAFAVTVLVVDVLHACGKLKPFFLAVCQPMENGECAGDVAAV